MLLYPSGLHTGKLSQLACICIMTMYLTFWFCPKWRTGQAEQTEFKIAVLIHWPISEDTGRVRGHNRRTVVIGAWTILSTDYFTGDLFCFIEMFCRGCKQHSKPSGLFDSGRSPPWSCSQHVAEGLVKHPSAESTGHFVLHAHPALLVAVCSFGKGGDGSVPSCASLPSHPPVPFHLLAGGKLHLGQSDVQ